MRLLKYALILIATISLIGCRISASADESLSPLNKEITFTENELDASFDAELCIPIALTGDSAECAVASVYVDGDTVTITKAGDYLVSGSLNGMLIVHADKHDTVRIILSDADIHSPVSAAIYVRSAEKVVLTVAEGTQNYLANGGEYIDIDESEIDAVIFSKDNLSINGSGLLSIDAAAGHGIVCKDSLRLANANLIVHSAKHAISAKDDIGVSNGSYAFTCEKDGFHAENNDNEALGNILILDGSFDIVSDGDALSAGNLLQINSGEFRICSGSGSENVGTHDNDPMRGRKDTPSSENGVSCKAFKSSGNMYINGGNYDIDSADDAFHSNDNLCVSGGLMRIRSGDDAMHADNNLTVYDGEIRILSAYEGLEGHTVDIYGGTIELTSDDDGINAAGGSNESDAEFGRGNPFDSDPEAYIHIYDGEIAIHCEGDGIDSNGEIRISGGSIRIFGPTNGGNGSLDSGTNAYIDSGSFCALGSYQMAEHFSESSEQCSLIARISGKRGSAVTVSDVSGALLFEITAENDFECIVLSLSEFEIGADYLLCVENERIDIHFESALYSAVPSPDEPFMNTDFGKRMQPPDAKAQPNEPPFSSDGSFH